MRFILFSKDRRGLVSMSMGHNRFYAFAMAGILSFSMAIFYGGYYLSTKLHGGPEGRTVTLSDRMAHNRKEFLAIKKKYEQKIDHLSSQLGKVKGEIMHLNTVAQRLIKMANIDSKEFNFDRDPSVGGPADTTPTTRSVIDGFFQELDAFEKKLKQREQKLGRMEKIMLHHQTRNGVQP